MHVLIVGQTGAGKSTLLRQMGLCYRRTGIPVLAFTTVRGDFDGVASHVFYDVDLFMQAVFASQRCAVFVDESGEVTSASRIKETAPLATRSRHLGHVVHFSAQRASGLIGPLVRNQTTRLYCFNVSHDDAKLLANDWGRTPEDREVILSAPMLEAGEYIHVERFPYNIEVRNLHLDKLYGRA